jgi:hypothetical protein
MSGLLARRELQSEDALGISQNTLPLWRATAVISSWYT